MKQARHDCSQSATPHGSMLVVVPVLVVLFIALAALTVDWGRIQLARGQLRAAADAAALAAAGGRLDANAVQRAVSSAANNSVLGQRVELSSDDVLLGTWDARDHSFNGGRRSANAVRVRARATVPLIFGPLIGRSSAQLRVSSTASSSSGGGGLIGLESIDVTGAAMIDSYDATIAPYRSAKAERAMVMSNGSIVLGAATTVEGDVRPGIGMQATGGRVTGTRQALDHVLDYPPVDHSEYAGRNDNNRISRWLNTAGDFAVAGNDVVNLPQGTYVVHDFYLAGTATLRATGPVTFYVTGALISHGNVSTSGSMPANFRIRVASAGRVYLTGNTTFYGTVYAPRSEVELTGSADYYGTFVGKTMLVGGAASVHDDESAREGARNIRLVE